MLLMLTVPTARAQVRAASRRAACRRFQGQLLVTGSRCCTLWPVPGFNDPYLSARIAAQGYYDVESTGSTTPTEVHFAERGLAEPERTRLLGGERRQGILAMRH